MSTGLERLPCDGVDVLEARRAEMDASEPARDDDDDVADILSTVSVIQNVRGVRDDGRR